MEGPITKRIGLFQDISGGTSVEKLKEEIGAAMQDSSVDEIILWVDSPGGSVDGTKEIADAIYAARGTKPMTAFIDGLGASAAYWIAAACDKIIIKDTTTMVGSIGVITTHKDVSKQEADRGVKTTVLTAGKYKAIDSQYGALSEEGAAMIQDRLDTLYSIFVQDVAKFRGVSVETVLTEMADGRVFLGQEAIDRGLVDGVSTLDALIATPCTPRKGVMQLPNPTRTQLEDSMDPNSPEALALVEKTKGDSVTAERQRMAGVLALSEPGYESLVQKMAIEGKTPGEAALALLTAKKTDLKAEGDDIHASAPKPLPTDGGTTATVSANQQTATERFQSDPNIRALYGTLEKYQAALALADQATADGRVHHFSKK
jgi:signal peptide peptidase SppA